jgi:diguanylate cyclase (GGDEF)-like protein
LAGSAYFFAASSVLAAAEAYARERRRRMYFERANRAPRETYTPEPHPLHDRLTGLPNRGLLADRLDQAIVVSRRDAKKCAGFYIDLDDFSAANASLGRDAGDEILQVVGQRLRQMMRESDTIARLEDDKFFIVTRDVDSIDVAKSIADRLLACVEQPVPLYRGSTAELRASIGICLFPYPDCTADDIVYRAEVAVGLAKQGGKHRYAFADPRRPSTQRVV